MKISETINTASGNMARPTKFNALLFPPQSLSDNYDGKAFDVMCKTVNVPETNMETIDIMYKGHNIKVPGRVNQQQEITMTFYLDEYHKMRRLIYDWISVMDDRFYGNKNSRTLRTAQTQDLFGGMILKARDFAESINEPMNYNFEYIYPTSVGGVEFNSSGVNEVLEFTVTFTYLKFSHISTLIDDIEDFDKKLDPH